MGAIQNRSVVSLLGVPAVGGGGGGNSLGGFIVTTGTSGFVTTTGFADLEGLGVAGHLSSNAVDWIISDLDSGELTYQGSETFSGLVMVCMTGHWLGGGEVTLRFVKNGSVLIDGVESTTAFADALPKEISMVSPLIIDAGDTLRIQLKSLIAAIFTVDLMSMQAW